MPSEARRPNTRQPFEHRRSTLGSKCSAAPGRIQTTGEPASKRGQEILLLRYRNDPYRQVYDTIKIIDQNNAVGVMHIGEFPNSLEFATFVMARHNYPFGLATTDDRKRIAAANTAAP